MEKDILILKRMDNGVTLKSVSEDCSGEASVRRECIEQDMDCMDESKGQAEMGQRVCNWVLEWLEIYGSKHDKFRVEVNIVQQHGDD